jgi:hypothetical protein
MSDTETGSTDTDGGDIEDSEAVVTDENGRIRFRTLRVNKGSGERNGDENNNDSDSSED